MKAFVKTCCASKRTRSFCTKTQSAALSSKSKAESFTSYRNSSLERVQCRQQLCRRVHDRDHARLAEFRWIPESPRDANAAQSKMCSTAYIFVTIADHHGLGSSDF